MNQMQSTVIRINNNHQLVFTYAKLQIRRENIVRNNKESLVLYSCFKPRIEVYMQR